MTEDGDGLSDFFLTFIRANVLCFPEFSKCVRSGHRIRHRLLKLIDCNDCFSHATFRVCNV